MSILNVFIDTNVLVRFFAFSKDNLDEAAKLSALIETKQIRVHVTEQVVDEFYRQRDRELGGSMRNFESGSINEQTPRFMDGYDELKLYRDAAQTLKTTRQSLLNKVRSDLSNQTLRADTLTTEIFDKSGVIPRTPEAIQAARLRKELGNPPGKDGQKSIGDQINWELLLTTVPSKSDIHIISLDGDFGDGEKTPRASSFLRQEWKKRNGGMMFLYAGLAEFTKEHFKDIKLPSDAKRIAGVKALIAARTYADTHTQIAILHPILEDLTTDDALALLRAFIDNGQIGGIYADVDVKAFYANLYLKFCLEVPSELDGELGKQPGKALFNVF